MFEIWFNIDNYWKVLLNFAKTLANNWECDGTLFDEHKSNDSRTSSAYGHGYLMKIE